jgi:SAM-dependent methyltransferase
MVQASASRYDGCMTTPDPMSLYTDARLVALYDALNPFAADTAFYLLLAATLPRVPILDIGCGTGLLASELARRGHDVTGIDPARAMLEVARQRAGGAQQVRWIEGDASAAAPSSAGLALMTGHVAQIFLDDASWVAPLTAIHRALYPGGWLAFESRNPQARPWERWTPERSRRTVDHPVVGATVVWQRLIEVRTDGDGQRVRFETHYRFERTDDEVVVPSELRFRSKDELAATLDEAGFSVTQWYGDWSGAPLSADSPELIVVATRS